MNKLKRIMDKIERTMAAVSFAEEGEYNTAKEILREGKRVLLAVRGGDIDRKTLKYALNTCKRIGADMDILYISSKNTVDKKGEREKVADDLGQESINSAVDATIQNFYIELEKEGIRYQLIQKTGCLKQEIIDYTNSRKDILFVVIESSDVLDIDCTGKNKRLSESWQNLKCPLVVVMDGA